VIETVEDNAGKYGPDLMCDFLCDFMDRNRSKPFFVYYPMVLVHNPFVKTPDTIGNHPRTQAANKAPKDKDLQKENFVAMVEYMDKIVGRLVEKVQAIGQEENTVILFTADNGTNRSITSRWHGQDIKGGKGGMKDMGTHVPLVASWPGKSPTGVVSDDLVDFTDIYPTFADAAGVSLGNDDPVDGRSFLPQISGLPGHSRECVFLHYQPYWNAQPGQFARTQKFKLYGDGRFFDVPNDLEESKALKQAGLSEASSRQQQMLQKVLDASPPAPTEPGNRKTTERPTYADWPHFIRNKLFE
jgi:arylsulfatase A-like enzyme